VAEMITDFGDSWLENLFDSHDDDSDRQLTREEIEDIFNSAHELVEMVQSARVRGSEVEDEGQERKEERNEVTSVALEESLREWDEAESREIARGRELEDRVRRAQASFSRAWRRVRHDVGKDKAWSDADERDDRRRGVVGRVDTRARLNRELLAVAAQLEAATEALSRP